MLGGMAPYGYHSGSVPCENLSPIIASFVTAMKYINLQAMESGGILNIHVLKFEIYHLK